MSSVISTTRLADCCIRQKTASSTLHLGSLAAHERKRGVLRGLCGGISSDWISVQNALEIKK